MSHQLIAFVPVALVLILTPGPDTLMIVRHSARGSRAGMAAIAGVVCGLTVHGTAAVVGLSALLATSAKAFAIVKLVGAAYLVFLGIKALIGSVRRRPSTEGAHRAPSTANAFRQALLTNLLNPKIAVFFVAFIPQFVRQDSMVAAQTAMLAATFVALTAAWFVVLMAGVSRASRALASATMRRWIDRVAGTTFVAFGLRLAASAR